MIPALGLDIGSHSFGKVFNTDLIRLRRLLAPVSRRRLTHEIHIDKDIHYGVLYEIELMAVLLPGLAVLVLKVLLELFHSAGFRELLFQIRQMRKRATESLHFIEDAQENIDDRILILLATCVALGIDIKKDHVRGRLRRQLHIRQNHRIGDFLVFHKVIERAPVAHLLILQQIGQNLQEVRFTASKEAGDPDAHLRCRTDNSFLISGEEIRKMLLQFPGDDIFFQFLGYVGLFALSDYDYALDLTIDRLSEHFF